MKRELLLPAAFAMDAVAGDPEWLPHPVRLMGETIARGEKLLRRPGQSARSEFLLGALLTSTVVFGSYAIADGLLHVARGRFKRLGDALEVLLAWTCLAARNLQDEAHAVLRALDAGDLPTARLRLSRIVGRDTADLNEAEIARAVIETLAESASDGIVAPMFYLALGGVPLAMAYKAVNTLDSMIGHADENHFYFGKFAARLDDVANLIPARLTAAFVVASAELVSGCNAQQALQVWVRDGAKHKSPNAGQPESAVAGALGVQLGGRNHYAGEPLDAPLLGAGLSHATPASARSAALLVGCCGMLALAVFSLSNCLRRTR